MSDAERQALVLDNLALAWHEGNRLWRTCPQARLLGSNEDVVQECLLALILAARGYRPELGFQFSTYAIKTMRNETLKAARQTGPIIRTPVHVWRKNASPRLRAARDRALGCGSLPKNAHDWLRAGVQDAPPEPAEIDRLLQALAELPPRDRRLLRLCYGLDGPQLTNAALASALKISRQRLHQIKQRALAQLRRLLE
jgi:RNA polymerase sigma factor (sigma-70 family)